MDTSDIKIGMGTDVHGFAPGRDLILGGVLIDHDMGLAGHSDADVLIHAVCDAILGAAGLGDIGDLFPDTDPKYKGIDSRILLAACARKLEQAGYRIINLDCTVFAQVPKLGPKKQEMAASMAESLEVPTGCVNVKATTTEHLGFIGRKEGIAAQAIVLIAFSSNPNSRET
ncbi:MAG: 2-C-methyl-D-erythritol 2,4-cyclodiphosphate synthase [Desulfotignum sp.]|nr:2-C-methyl-D-erythritol 2,4-cyclodiphosphate synthase [Desulfotignum sp.]